MSLNRVNIEPVTEDILRTLDLVLILDHSGSMERTSNRLKGKTRYDEVHEQAIMAADVMSRYDDDGITLIHFAGAAKVSDGVNGDAVERIFKEIRPGGSTALHLALQELGAKARATKKEVVGLVFTDGEPDNQQAVLDVMNALGQEFGRPKIGICFIQVGTDAGATTFLDYLDNNLKVDISAHFSEEEAEGLTIQQLVNAARTE